MNIHTALLPNSRTLDFDGTHLVLHVSPRDRDLAASVPGLRFHKASETWRGDPTLACALTLRGVFGNALDVTDAAYAAVQPEVDKAFAVQAVKNGEQTCPAIAHPALDGLFEEQKPASWAAALQGGFIIGDDKGSGKTVMAAGVLNLLGPDAFPALVVATNTMKFKWAEEIRKWVGCTVEVAGKTKAQRQKAITSEADVVILSWEQLRTESFLAPYGSTHRTDAEKEPGLLNEVPWQVVIADEAHRAKNPKAKQTRALWAVGHGESVTHRVALTATPVTKSVSDMWGILHFVRPQDWPSRSRFLDRYVLMAPNPFGGLEELGLNPRTEDEFRSIFEPHYIRRKLNLPVRQLPPDFRFVEMQGEQKRVYKQFEKESIAQTDGRFIVAVGPLSVNLRLQQMAQATPVVDDDGNVVDFTRPSCKLDALEDLLDEMGGDPLVVFSASKLLIKFIYRELTGPKGRFAPEQVGQVHGDRSPEQRTADVDAFQRGEMPLILCTIDAGAEGITLTRANTLCFLNRSYRAITGNNQAEGRVFRIGQDRDVQIIDIITRDSEELRVHESGAIKEHRLQEVVQDEGWTPRELPEMAF